MSPLLPSVESNESELKREGDQRGEKHELERPGQEKPEVQAGRVREKDERTR